MIVANLGASRSFGGPERQILDLAVQLSRDCQPLMLSFSEGGRCREFLAAVRQAGLDAIALEHDTPYLWSAVDELTDLLDRLRVDVLCCHGYKADLLGRLATRRLRIPAVAVAHGWTGESYKVRLYEALDRLVMRYMDHVTCVSAAQADKVRQSGVPSERITIIRNAVRAERFAMRDPRDRGRLQQLFPPPVKRIVGVVGRLSPEKGFDVMLRCAMLLAQEHREIGIVWFGDGPLREEAARQIAAAGLGDTLMLAGFCDHLDRLIPHFDVLALPSYTEGLPSVVLEAFAAGVPVVATQVGGTPEAVNEGQSGYLVPSGNAPVLAQRLVDILACEEKRLAMGAFGRQRVLEEFTFESQGLAYRRLFSSLLTRAAGTLEVTTGRGKWVDDRGAIE